MHGLEDSVDLVANATPEQLSHVFDLDLWRPTRPGLDDQFDAERFGTWIEVLAEAGPDLAAGKLAAMPLPQIVAGLAHHVRVFDASAVASYETTDGTRIDYSRPVRDLTGCEIGGYHVAATREGSWDAIVAVLVALDVHHPDRFIELMRAVRSRSHSRRERDGFHALLENRDQMMFDAGDERERRREQHGFASPAEARAFLQTSRNIRPGGPAQPDPIARAYFRSIEEASAVQNTPVQPDDADVEVVVLLAEAGVLPLQAPRGLLTGGGQESTRPATHIESLMRQALERDQLAYGARNAELAFLANVLMSGCSIQSRPFTAKEASEAAMAVCNLGLERLAPPDDFLLAHDLVGVFQIGWTILHEQACLGAANALIDALARIRVADDEIQGALNLLGIQMKKQVRAGTPWRAAQALDVIMMLDKPAWAALVSLVAECPILHAAIRAHGSRALTIDPVAFEWISDSRQIETIGKFLDALPEMLGAP